MTVLRCLILAGLMGAAPALAGPIPQEAPSEISPFTQVQTSNARFNRWISGFRGRALRQGISASTFDTAFADIDLNATVIERDRNQSEFSKALWEYLDTAVSDARIRNGRRALENNTNLLNQIEATYGVDKEVVVAIWGLESAYGAVRGSTNVIEAMATLAYEARRGEFFEEQLVAALQIIEAGDTAPRNMTGSWAGAMGHTQFIPTSFLDYAVDGNGDGWRDIWSDDPTDALASTANYLRSFGWTLGQPWGVEVQLPDGFDYATARRENEQLPSAWAALGVADLNGRAVSDHARASILLPGGAEGAAFMIFPNFEVLERYNTADAYVIGVGHLSDRIAGGPAIQATWPRADGALSAPQRRELQERLTAAGFDTTKIDGRIGPLTINAIRDYQLANGLTPDGYASVRLLQRLR
ncbi:lytic murein transglycosylase [Octadecabacter temperatus]|uniref:Membrane-bound lytic murein transglycosylase B n=1 Tax=Octadecabacter temperatus TaxID=1458307 RepID=A0A0K0Y184_9RHOB|nr:lytic murein transglycosylase [Octadecabacter temperatus]AKS44646.1 Membrane-bound lytic murein transglycosylase B precursor [Octadecabacter temperatus]SIO37042.1 lytic murein transglycosylase [Octadecabacter temperatus]